LKGSLRKKGSSSKASLRAREAKVRTQRARLDN